MSTHRELSVQSGRHMPCLWLVEFWCTRSRDSAPLIKSWNFTEHSRTSFSFAKGKKNKNKVALPHLFLKKVSEKHIYN